MFGAVVTSCSQTNQTKEEPFKYTVDEFADLQILRYQIPGWDSLSLNQKAYIYHLSEATKCGRDIFFDQNFKYNLKIRKTLEQIIENYKGDKESPDYKNFLVYAKRVFFSNGIHHHYAEDKFTPTCSQDYFKSLMVATAQEDKCAELLPVIFDPALYAQRKYTGKERDLIEASAVNFYGDHITKDEVNKFYSAMENPKDTCPVSFGLNSRLIKENGKLVEEVYKVDGKYSNSIKAIIGHLAAAKEVAENDTQKNYIAQLIEYYTTGSLKTWDDFNISWVQDNHSQVDFVNGFIESYNDPLGRKATWESIVNFKDLEASKRTNTISDNAQWFEDNSPVDSKFKKKEVKGVSAKVITVACLGGDSFPATPIGINLPNSNWIRKDYGSKSVTIANITDAYEKASLESPKSTLAEFAWDENEMNLIKQYGPLTGNLHTDLHECLGHGSGQLLPGVSDAALGEYSSSLEEARADLFALYYLADPKLVELGIVPSTEAYKAEYINFIRNGIFTQFTRVELGKTNTQAHMQDRKLISEWCYEKGLKANNPGAGQDVIEKKMRDGKTYFVINDYQKLRSLFGQLLAQMQRIKSEGDFNAGKNLIETYAVNIEPTLHKEVKERFDALQLKPYRGFINPTITPVEKDGKIIDYVINYNDNYLDQMMEYGKKYSYETI
ncbi:MAG: dihydrofolate reductase [Bacteroidales bacterium]